MSFNASEKEIPDPWASSRAVTPRLHITIRRRVGFFRGFLFIEVFNITEYAHKYAYVNSAFCSAKGCSHWLPMKYEWSFGAATFKRRLIVLMEEKGLSQQTVAELAGVTQGAVSRWLSGSKPEIESVTVLAKKADVPLSWLAYGEGKLPIDYKGIDGFILRAKSAVLPRLNDVITKFSTLQDANFLSPEEREIIEDIEQKLRGRRARLAACVDALEKLPPEEEWIVREILSKHCSPVQTDFVRGEVCVALGLRGTATDDEILEACRAALKRHPGSFRKTARRGKGGVNATVYKTEKDGKTVYSYVLDSEKNKASIPK